MKYVKDLAVRISIAILLLIIPFNIFYFLLSQATLQSSLPFLYLLGYSISVEGYTLLIDSHILKFVPACVATSAYYLLTLLVLLTKDIKLKDRFCLVLYGSFLIFLMNIIRIDILLYVLIEFGKNWFDKIHIFFWHLISSVYVALVWIFLAYKFKVKSIPVYSDFKFLLSQSIFVKKKPLKKRGKKKSSKKRGKKKS